jgi:rhodanese-related sulfurtransferase
VVVATGVTPRTGLLKRAGARLGPQGAALIDARARTSLPAVFACGTCVAATNALTRKPFFSPQAALADKTAQVAGENAGGGRATIGPALGTAIVRVGALTLGRTGLTAAEAKKMAGARLLAVTTNAPNRDPFLGGGAEAVTVRLTLDRRDGRLLGAEVAGTDGVDKRLDVLATALRGRLGVQDLAALDLSYAAPFSMARDAVNVAATVAEATREGRAIAWSPAALAGKAKGVLVEDVRSSTEGGTIPGARHLPLPRLRDEIGTLPPAIVVFVDSDGRRGYLAARIATQRGWRRAGYLTGGLASWRAHGLSVEGA